MAEVQTYVSKTWSAWYIGQLMLAQSNFWDNQRRFLRRRSDYRVSGGHFNVLKVVNRQLQST